MAKRIALYTVVTNLKNGSKLQSHFTNLAAAHDFRVQARRMDSVESVDMIDGPYQLNTRVDAAIKTLETYAR